MAHTGQSPTNSISQHCHSTITLHR